MATQSLVFILPLGLYLLHNTQKIYQHYLATFATSLMLIFVLLFSGRFKLNWDSTKTYASLTALLFLLIMINFSSSGFEPFWHDTNQATITALSDYSNANYSRFNIWAIALVICLIAHLCLAQVWVVLCITKWWADSIPQAQ
ncbi:MAG: hypothetical protein Rsou_0541 [Candidatus Ruthia sp. Asou_11_S2]|nr:hypothetical protein [Candidatus Ruthia sp. Asou_11_S2]